MSSSFESGGRKLGRRADANGLPVERSPGKSTLTQGITRIQRKEGDPPAGGQTTTQAPTTPSVADDVKALYQQLATTTDEKKAADLVNQLVAKGQNAVTIQDFIVSQHDDFYERVWHLIQKGSWVSTEKGRYVKDLPSFALSLSPPMNGHCM